MSKVLALQINVHRVEVVICGILLAVLFLEINAVAQLSFTSTHPAHNASPSGNTPSARTEKNMRALLAGMPPQNHTDMTTMTCAKNAVFYSIGAGDTLEGIATRYSVPVQELASYNGLASPNFIQIHQHICIPPSGTITLQSTLSSTTTTSGGQTTQQMIQHVFGLYGDQAVRIATCESSLQPDATNPTAIGGSHAAGLFQVLFPSTWITTVQAAKSPYDTQANIEAAHEIFTRDGNSWREWVCQP